MSADRLVIAARYYTMTAWRVTQALRPIAEERGDSGVIAAVETIAALAGPIASKTYRAVSGAADDDFDRFDLEGDANGSAKVARLTVAESRRAWQVLMEIGRATADGVPMALYFFARWTKSTRGSHSGFLARCLSSGQDLIRVRRPWYDPYDSDDESVERAVAGQLLFQEADWEVCLGLSYFSGERSYRWSTSFPKEAERDAGSWDRSYPSYRSYLSVCQRSATPGGAKMSLRRG